MKTVIAALLVGCAFYVSAQTNYGTITFTNKNGAVTRDVIVTKVETAWITYKEREGVGGGRVRLSELPADLRARFGYNEAAASEVEAAEKKRKAASLAADEQARTLQSFKADLDRRKRAAEKKTVILDCRVIQKLKEGLLVSLSLPNGTRGYRQTDELVAYRKKLSTGEYWQRLVTDGDVALLTMFPDYSTTVDGDCFSTIAWPTGEFHYTTVQNSEKTVRKYTCDLDVAASFEK